MRFSKYFLDRQVFFNRQDKAIWLFENVWRCDATQVCSNNKSFLMGSSSTYVPSSKNHPLCLMCLRRIYQTLQQMTDKNQTLWEVGS